MAVAVHRRRREGRTTEVIAMTIVADAESHTSVPQPRPRPSAVVWINGRMAKVVCCDADGHVSTRTIERGVEPGFVFLAAVVREIGNRERVMILGPSSARVTLEREYVATYRRPERLVDVEPAGLVDEGDLIGRLRQLAV
jgi:hypothetical protein